MHLRTALILATVTTTTAAFSQVTPTPLGITIRAGYFQPSSGTGGAFGDNWFTAGVEVDFFRLKVGPVSAPMRAKITVSVDTYSKGGASSLPILANFVAHMDRWKFTFGLGAAVADLPASDTTVNFAYQVGIGYDLPWAGLPLTAEARFIGVNGVGAALDGFALTLGFRI